MVKEYWFVMYFLFAIYFFDSNLCWKKVYNFVAFCKFESTQEDFRKFSSMKKWVRNFLKIICRSSHQRCSVRKGILACKFIKKETLAQVFSCEFCETSKNIIFIEHLWWLLLNWWKNHELSRYLNLELKTSL